jgi:anti-sigma factor RsiW
MRSHREIEKLLAVYNALDASELRIVDEHTRTCGVCAARRSAYAEMDAHLAGLPDPRPSADLSNALSAILQGDRPTSRQRVIASDPRLTSRRVLLPVGLLLLLILTAWLIMRISAPVHRGIAETPSVTPTMTPAAMASPQRQAAISPVDQVGWLSNRDPVSRMPAATATGRAMAPGFGMIQLTPVAFRSAVAFGLSISIAHR